MRLSLCLAGVLVAGVMAIARGQETTSFAGKWSGPWINSLGEKGQSELKLTEDGDGTLTGIWDNVKMTGKRINTNTVELSGKTETRSYQITATINDGKMTLKYIVTRLDMEGAYNGSATLMRVKQAS